MGGLLGGREEGGLPAADTCWAGRACRQARKSLLTTAGAAGRGRLQPVCPHPTAHARNCNQTWYTLAFACSTVCREDPELRPAFEDIKKGGMAAMMKYMNDPAFLAVRLPVPLVPPALCNEICTQRML